MKRTILERITSAFWPRNQVSDWPEENPANPHRINGSVNGSTALSFSGCWAATNTIAGLFGTMPAKVYRKTADGREEATKHSVYKLLGREPNPDMDSFIFWEMMTQWWVNYGNAFAEIVRRENSRQIVALHPIHPSRMTREKGSNGEYTGRWLVRNNNGSDTPLEADEVFNIVGALSDDGVIGKGVLHYASKTIATALAEQGYRADFYANGGRPSGTLEHPAKLSTEARDNLRREWKTVHGRGNEIAILWEGMKFNPSSVAPEHAEIINSSVFSVQEIARFYDLPPHVLYELSHGTFANVEEMNRFLVSHSLNRRLVRVEKACGRQLFTEQEKAQEYYVKFTVDALLRGNPKEQAEIDQVLFNIGAKSADEIRAHREMNNLPDGKGKTYYIRRDIAPIDLVIAAAERDIENPAPIPGTPPSPATPPALGNAWKELAKSYRTRYKNELENYRTMEDSLSEKIATLDSALIDREKQIKSGIGTITALTQERDKAAGDCVETTAKAESLRERLDAIAAERDALEASNAALKSNVEKESLAYRVEKAARESADLMRFDVEGLRAKAVEELEASNATIAKLTASAEQDALALLEACEQRDSLQARLDTATESLAKVQNAVETLQTERSAADIAHAEALAAANRRTEEGQTKATALALEVGTLRAECDGLKQQRGTIDGERIRAVNEGIELRAELRTAGELTAKAKQEAEKATNDAKTLISDTKETVSASIRALLDASLDSLLWKEPSMAKDCAKNYDLFKDRFGAFQVTFLTELTARLQQAATALEAVGHQRVDVAKIASDYVAESRKRLNIAFNGTNRNEIRHVIRAEVEAWDRKEELTSWIGE